MNDRGLSLSPTEMLKGYLLSSISDDAKRTAANNRWRDRIRELNDAGKEVEPDSFKAWFRSQYATRIRERRRGAKPEDFDRIGTEFHRWLRDASDQVGLAGSDDFYRFIDRDFDFYTRLYLRLLDASERPVAGLERVLYNAQHGFTLQYILLLAPITPTDPAETVDRKLQLVARFVDILLAWRLWNVRSIAYSTMQYAMFLAMREIRGLEPELLAQKLHEILGRESERFGNEGLRVHQQNRYAIHRLLARLTDYVETESGLPSHYLDYVTRGRNPFEVEHIWANHPERHADEFPVAEDFYRTRDRIGGLLLLPKSFNASYGDLTYAEKLPQYFKQNLLASSLHPLCYERDPGFLKFVRESGLPFRPHPEFQRADHEARRDLYRQVAERIWNPDDLLREPAP